MADKSKMTEKEMQDIAFKNATISYLSGMSKQAQSTSSRLSALERHASSTAKAKAKKAKKAKRGINTKLKGMAGFQGFGQMPK